jgi:curved DNA-binding protein CbpA
VAKASIYSTKLSFPRRRADARSDPGCARDHDDEVSMGSQREPEELSAVPQISAECDLGSLSLTPGEGFLLSRVDGRTTWGLLREIGGLSPDEVDTAMCRFLELGVIVLECEKPEPDGSAHELPGSEAVPAVGAPAPSAVDESMLDAGLDISIEAQRSMLAFECGLGRPYHEILGVAADAELRELRRAYFKLSKEFHPDRYFRRNLGAFSEVVQRVFRKIAEAFELLSDPSARKEMERSLQASPSAAPRVRGPRLRGRTTPNAFSLVARIQRERRRKARQYFEAGESAIAQESWVDAAKHLRLAIACDPANETFKGPFAEAIQHANEILADRYMKEADSRFDLGEYAEAYKRYVDSLHCRPFDAEANHRAAKLAWRIEDDLKSAKDFAARACEVEPGVALYRKTLGQVYAAAGLYKNAEREFEQAVKLDPRDEEAKLELKTTRRNARNAPLGGS